MKNIYLLGATGSIGNQVIDIIRRNKKKFTLRTIAVGTNIAYAKDIINEFEIEFVSVQHEEDAVKLQAEFPNLAVGFGRDGLIKAATYGNNGGVVINAVVGMIGLEPTIAAINKGRNILLANKESLVVGGEIITKLASEKNVSIIPIDSEHNAIFQVINGEERKDIKRLIITASGGSFRDYSREMLANVTVKEALKHPNWSMGAKITIDSATMVNKGLEVIEAHYLFGIDYDNIETVIHPESIIHSMVEFVDGNILAQISNPDMRLPISYALSYPQRFDNDFFVPLDFTKEMNWSFRPMDFTRFPLLKLAFDVGKAGGILPTVYNASNEVANKLFRAGKISFLDIEKIIFASVAKFENIANPSLTQILETDKRVRKAIDKNEVSL